MRRLPIVTLALILLLCSATSLSSSAQDKNTNASTSIVSAAAYPDSQEGLKKLIEDVFGAMKSGDREKTSSYFSSLMIPDHTTWFMKEFGPVEGARMNAKYEELLQQEPDAIRKQFEYATSGGMTNLTISKWQEPANGAQPLNRAVMEAMKESVPIYSADGTSPQEKYRTHMGDFIYVEGGFRYIDTPVFLALSTAPHSRIRVGSNVQAAALTHKVAPIYPDEAKTAHTEGPVVLHVIVGIDGKISEATLVSGDPLLGKAAIDAVRQWEYRPTKINSTPIEVDTTVTVDFHLP